MKKSIGQDNNAKISRFLGLDYGRAHIGLAIADGETRLAFRYGTIENDKQFYVNLLSIIRKEEITTVIIGIPSYINQEETEYEAEKLGQYLESVEKIKVFYENEMFSTIMAQENLRAKGMKNVSALDHEEAARIILQSWLDKTKNNNQ